MSFFGKFVVFSFVVLAGGAFAQISSVGDSASKVDGASGGAKVGVFRIGDENSLLVWSRDIDPSADFRRMPNNLSKEAWINNAGLYWDAPGSVSNEDFDKFQATLYNKIFSILNGENLSRAYSVCIENHTEASRSQYQLIEARISRAQTQAQRMKLQSDYDIIRANNKSISQSWCAFKFLRRALYTLNVPNHPGESRRPDDSKLEYEELWNGQVYRAVNSMVRGDFTGQFYEDVKTELMTPPNKWMQDFQMATPRSLRKKIMGDVPLYQARIIDGYINQVGIIHTLISVKKLVKP